MPQNPFDKVKLVQVMVITWANVDFDLDMCRHTALLGHSELTHYGLVMAYGVLDRCQN